MFTPSIIVVMLLWTVLCFLLPVMRLLEISETIRIYYSNFIQVGSPILATLLCFRTAWVFGSGDPMRKVWLFLGLGILSWGIGALLAAIYQIVNPGLEVPYPWIADIGYLLMVPLISTALIIFKLALRVKTPLWGIIAGFAVFSGALALALSSSVGNLQEARSALVYFVEIAYIVLDPILLGLTVSGASVLAGGIVGRPWWFGMTGLVLYYLGNIGYDYLEGKGEYITGSYIDVTWPLAFALLAMAAMMTHVMFRPEEE